MIRFSNTCCGFGSSARISPRRTQRAQRKDKRKDLYFTFSSLRALCVLRGEIRLPSHRRRPPLPPTVEHLVEVVGRRPTRLAREVLVQQRPDVALPHAPQA